MNEDVARQVKASREMIARLESSGNGWQGEQAQWVGRLETQLEMLCDAIEAQDTSQQDTESGDGNG